jgi:serine/alanine adding enzyme
MQGRLVTSTDEWTTGLNAFPDQDIYFTPEYAACYNTVVPGTAEAFLYEDGGQAFLFPFRKREIPFTVDNETLYDITSEYGYGGPLSTSTDKEFLANAYSALEKIAQENRFVCEFVRYHPLFKNETLAAVARNPLFCGQTVVMQTDLPEEELLLQARTKLRRDYHRGLRTGATVVPMTTTEGIDAFYDIYIQTMENVAAQDFYFFDKAFFQKTLSCLHDRATLLLAIYEEKVIAGSLFLQHGSYLHYHFSGMDRTHPEARKINGITVLLCEAARHAHENGVRQFHLGGGLGGQDDSLFHFKERFSKTRARFHVSKHVYDQGLYDHLVSKTNGGETKSFFPIYRAPRRSRSR